MSLETQLSEALKAIDILQGELDKVKKEMSQKWWEGLGIGAGGATVIFFILYFTVLPNVR
ncbi:MAG TPA: hypothetical protein PLA71_05845 [Saccharofermentans sp.]|nr:hypothetical protein [Saccharofermentans sp.]